MDQRGKLIGELTALESELDGARKQHVQSATELAVHIENFRRIREGVALAPPSELFESAAASIVSVRGFVHFYVDDEIARTSALESVLTVSSNTTSATAIVASSTTLDPELWRHIEGTLPPLNSWSRDRVKRFAGMLDELAPNLGALAISAWEHYYVGTVEGARASLTATRELFNQVFWVIAPDKEVRKSEFFAKKVGDKPDQVHRAERLRYAAHRYIKERVLREVVLDEGMEILKTLDELNRLHAPAGTIDESAARRAVVAMQAQLEQWLLALRVNP